MLLQKIQIMQRHILLKVINFALFSGIALEDLGKFNEAITMYDRAIQIDPNIAYAYTSKGKNLILFLGTALR